MAVRQTRRSAPEDAAPDEAASKTDPYVAVALQRGLHVLEILAAARAALPLAEIARRAGLTRGVAFRLAHTLERAGYLERVDKVPSYRAGGRVMLLGFSYLRSLGLPELARPYLERLRDRTAASAHMGVLEGRDVLYVARLPARQGILNYLDIGDRSPAHASAIGQAMLSRLSEEQLTALYRGVKLTTQGEPAPRDLGDLRQVLAEARQRGYTTSVGALHPNVLAVAAPILDWEGRLAGALSVTALDPGRVHEVTDLARQVLAAARDVSVALGYSEAALGSFPGTGVVSEKPDPDLHASS